MGRELRLKVGITPPGAESPTMFSNVVRVFLDGNNEDQLTLDLLDGGTVVYGDEQYSSVFVIPSELIHAVQEEVPLPGEPPEGC